MYQWGDSRRFNSYSRFCKAHYGGRVQRLPIDAGFSCPNRTKRSEGGCSYCSNTAFTPSYLRENGNIITQLNRGKEFFKRRYPSNNGYFAYFQAFSNTFCSVNHLMTLCKKVMEVPEIQGIIISTRPDCLPDKILDLLSDLNKITNLCIEIGVESFHNDTLEHINRGHNVECSFKAFEMLRKRNILACAHLIFGLPYETPHIWMEDIKLLNKLNPDFVKFHQLQILKGTKIESEYEANHDSFHTFTIEEYVKFICDYIERLSPNIVIERFTAEVPQRFLSISHFGFTRHDVLVKMIETELAFRNSYQGCKALY